ncbi:hypothetical protein L1987_59098 [Smallanthus sonchifolius]|uniref:Uncharacterized protein n=1 Tax=Smallanthus sonchifolius TaxID=185202 RepID=A0ACB9D4L9_9ASTR|nr:hypothetical protein L1987_59098 [Smallanthus sonchifolius]
MEKVKLFATWSSPFAKRVVWALKLKGMEYEIVYEDRTNLSPQLLMYNPVYKKAPVLVHNEVPICDSLVILEYIDEIWKDATPFLPRDPLPKANERFWAKFGDEQVLPAFYGCYKKQGKDQEEAKETTLAHLKRVEQLLNEKKFLSGESFGFLDLAFGWLADSSHPLEVVTGLKLLDEDSFPNLCIWRDNFLKIPAINESWPDQETLTIKLQKSKGSNENNRNETSSFAEANIGDEGFTLCYHFPNLPGNKQVLSSSDQAARVYKNSSFSPPPPLRSTSIFYHNATSFPRVSIQQQTLIDSQP